MDRYGKDIIKYLERIASSGHRPSEIFQDFLAITHSSLEALPAHVKAVTDQVPMTDTPETEKLFVGLKEKYKPVYWESFQRAFGALLNSSGEFQDTIGNVYMEFGWPNKGTGQFFTPYPIAAMMARMTMGDIERQAHDRIKAACEKSIEAQAFLVASLIIKDPDEAAAWFFNRVLPAAAPYVEPIRVLDCCCGSGVMLLAAAEQTPRWALDWGIVQLYGQDIDQTCVRMAQINMMLYGLNSYSMKCALALSPEELASVPEPWKEKFTEAQAADQAGDQEKVEEIKEELRSWQQNALF